MFYRDFVRETDSKQRVIWKRKVNDFNIFCLLFYNNQKSVACRGFEQPDFTALLNHSFFVGSLQMETETFLLLLFFYSSAICKHPFFFFPWQKPHHVGFLLWHIILRSSCRKSKPPLQCRVPSAWRRCHRVPQCVQDVTFSLLHTAEGNNRAILWVKLSRSRSKVAENGNVWTQK